MLSLSGVHSELSWLLSVVKDTESDMREGEEQLLLFWLLLATVSSSNESTSLLSSEPKQTGNDISVFVCVFMEKITSLVYNRSYCKCPHSAFCGLFIYLLID